jgi:pimeloyl-ACP methyl ester carboxylesterase
MNDALITVSCHQIRTRWIEGSSPTLVFLHDSLGCIETWRDYPATLAEKTGLSALIYDRVGHGGSSPFVEQRNTNYMHIEALELLPKVIEAYQIEQAILIGHSDGGSIALIAASQLPQIKGVITEGAHVFVEEETLAGIQEAIKAYEHSDIAKRLERYHGDKAPALVAAWSRTWIASWFRDWNIEDVLPKITCPVLVIQGLEDEFGTTKQVSAISSQVSGKGQELLIPDCGHTPHKEARAITEGAMLEFISRLFV